VRFGDNIKIALKFCEEFNLIARIVTCGAGSVIFMRIVVKFCSHLATHRAILQLVGLNNEVPISHFSGDF
jgi:hypothetical protein